MPRKILDTCVGWSCQAACPVDAISEGDIFKVDPDKCVDCGACQEACPTDSITEE